MASQVGSPTTATSGCTPRPGRAASTASAPVLASSSSATRASTTRPGGRRRGQLLGGDDHRRDAALHVARAAAAEAVGLDGRGERVGHALDADGVEVAGEHDGRAGRRSRPAGRWRPGSGGRRGPAAVMTWVANPLRCSRFRRCSTMAASPAAPGTSPGFTESMATSSAVSATAASPSARRGAVGTSAARRRHRGVGARCGRRRRRPAGRRRGRRWPPGDPTPTSAPVDAAPRPSWVIGCAARQPPGHPAPERRLWVTSAAPVPNSLQWRGAPRTRPGARPCRRRAARRPARRRGRGRGRRARLPRRHR